MGAAHPVTPAVPLGAPPPEVAAGIAAPLAPGVASSAKPAAALGGPTRAAALGAPILGAAAGGSTLAAALGGAVRAAEPVDNADSQLFAYASAAWLDNRFTRGLWRRYVEEFGKIVAGELHDFNTLELSTEQRHAIAARVKTAIKRIASFAAWYDLIGLLFRSGYTVALLGGYVAVVVFGAVWYRGNHDVAASLLAIAAGLASVALADRCTRTMARSWPLDAIACIVALGVVSLVPRQPAFLHWTSVHSQTWPTPLMPSLLAIAWGIAAFAAILLVVLLVVHRSHSWVTTTKLRVYPEDEIIESLTVLLSKLATARGAWISGRVRSEIVDDLEWIAGRFECDYLARFYRGDAATDSWLQQTGARLAAACRLRERMVAVQQTGGMELVSEYATVTLVSTASGDWRSIEQANCGEPPLRRRLAERFTDGMKIIFPAVVGGVVFFIPALPPEIRQNALLTGVLTSVLGLWGALDPQRAEKGLDATKTLGDILRTK